MKSVKLAAVVSVVVALAALAGMEWLSWCYMAPLPPDPGCEVALARTAAKTEVVRRVRDGELTLFQAAASFRDIGATGDANDEALCRQVISWASLEEEGGKSAALVVRLQDELDDHLLDNGGVVLGAE